MHPRRPWDIFSSMHSGELAVSHQEVTESFHKASGYDYAHKTPVAETGLPFLHLMLHSTRHLKVTYLSLQGTGSMRQCWYLAAHASSAVTEQGMGPQHSINTTS